jgi:hypothetical protein
MDHSITTPAESPSDNGFLFVLARLLAAAGAVACCWLLYRFANGFWNNYKRTGRRPDRRNFSGRKDILYSRLGTGMEPYQDQDEDEGYHDDSVLAQPKSWVNTNRALPDKPLPPLPPSDAT